MKYIKIITILLLAPGFALGQIRLSGDVVDDQTGMPLSGATIRFAANKYVASADASGRFTINLKTLPDSVYVGFTGYRQLKVVVNTTEKLLHFRLIQQITQLTEVVVSTGYQTLPKERATGSFDLISNQLYNREVSPDVISRLDGLSTGILFDKRNGINTNFSVRGLSTLTSSMIRPLIVIDNFPYDGDINNINPNDVESVTILKDAAAASIWGVSAGNGVVVITTKKGKFDRPVQVTLTANSTITNKPDLFALPIISSSDFIDAEKYLFTNGFYNSLYTNTTNRPVLSPVEEILNQQKNGLISAAQANSQIDAFRNIDVRNDFEKYIYRKALNQQYHFDISGGNKQTTNYLSVGWDKDQSSLIGNDNGRLTIRNANDYRPVKNLQIHTAIQYTSSTATNNSPGGYGGISNGGGRTGLYPYARLADANGNPLALEKDYRLSYIDTAGSGRLLNWKYIPLQELNTANNTTVSHDILLNAGVDYEIISGLNAGVKYQYERSGVDTRNLYDDDTYFARNLINRYTQVTGSTVNRIIPIGDILDQGQTVINSNNVRGQLDYSHGFGRSGVLSALIGGEIKQASTDASAGRSYGFNDNILTSTPVDLVTKYPIYGTLAGTQAIPNVANFNGLLQRSVSYYGNASYSYLGKYIFSISARKDASNLFGVESNKKGTPLGSAGLAWNLSDEKFYHLAWLPRLKLRATYGYAGNVNTAISALTTLTYSQPNALNSINNLPSAVITNFPNPNLRWEKVGTLNLGVDFSALNDRISGTAEYYNKNATDLVGQMPADITEGAGLTLQANTAQLRTNGWDVTLNSRNVQGKVSWNTTLLFSFSSNKVEKYLFEQPSLNFYINNGASITPLTGQPAYSIISYKWAGLDPANGNPRVYLNGKVSEDYAAITTQVTKSDLVYSGSALPLYFGSVRNDFSYKNIGLSINIAYRFDYYFRRTTTSYSDLFSSWIGYSDFSQRWQNPGDELHTQVPSMVYPANSARDQVYNYSDQTVEKADNIRIQDVRLSYNLFRTANFKLPFKSVQIFGYARNPGIIWKATKLKIDPDNPQGLPAPASYSLGCNVTF